MGGFHVVLERHARDVLTLVERRRVPPAVVQELRLMMQGLLAASIRDTKVQQSRTALVAPEMICREIVTDVVADVCNVHGPAAELTRSRRECAVLRQEVFTLREVMALLEQAESIARGQKGRSDELHADALRAFYKEVLMLRKRVTDAEADRGRLPPSSKHRRRSHQSRPSLVEAIPMALPIAPSAQSSGATPPVGTSPQPGDRSGSGGPSPGSSTAASGTVALFDYDRYAGYVDDQHRSWAERLEAQETAAREREEVASKDRETIATQFRRQLRDQQEKLAAKEKRIRALEKLVMTFFPDVMGTMRRVATEFEAQVTAIRREVLSLQAAMGEAFATIKRELAATNMKFTVFLGFVSHCTDALRRHAAALTAAVPGSQAKQALAFAPLWHFFLLDGDADPRSDGKIFWQRNAQAAQIARECCAVAEGLQQAHTVADESLAQVQALQTSREGGATLRHRESSGQIKGSPSAGRSLFSILSKDDPMGRSMSPMPPASRPEDVAWDDKPPPAAPLFAWAEGGHSNLSVTAAEAASGLRTANASVGESTAASLTPHSRPVATPRADASDAGRSPRRSPRPSVSGTPSQTVSFHVEPRPRPNPPQPTAPPLTPYLAPVPSADGTSSIASITADLPSFNDVHGGTDEYGETAADASPFSKVLAGGKEARALLNDPRLLDLPPVVAKERRRRWFDGGASLRATRAQSIGKLTHTEERHRDKLLSALDRSKHAVLRARWSRVRVRVARARFYERLPADMKNAFIRLTALDGRMHHLNKLITETAGRSDTLEQCIITLDRAPGNAVVGNTVLSADTRRRATLTGAAFNAALVQDSQRTSSSHSSPRHTSSDLGATVGKASWQQKRALRLASVVSNAHSDTGDDGGGGSPLHGAAEPVRTPRRTPVRNRRGTYASPMSTPLGSHRLTVTNITPGGTSSPFALPSPEGAGLLPPGARSVRPGSDPGHEHVYGSRPHSSGRSGVDTVGLGVGVKKDSSSRVRRSTDTTPSDGTLRRPPPTKAALARQMVHATNIMLQSGSGRVSSDGDTVTDATDGSHSHTPRNEPRSLSPTLALSEAEVRDDQAEPVRIGRPARLQSTQFAAHSLSAVPAAAGRFSSPHHGPGGTSPTSPGPGLAGVEQRPSVTSGSSSAVRTDSSAGGPRLAADHDVFASDPRGVLSPQSRKDSTETGRELSGAFSAFVSSGRRSTVSSHFASDINPPFFGVQAMQQTPTAPRGGTPLQRHRTSVMASVVPQRTRENSAPFVTVTPDSAREADAFKPRGSVVRAPAALSARKSVPDSRAMSGSPPRAPAVKRPSVVQLQDTAPPPRPPSTARPSSSGADLPALPGRPNRRSTTSSIKGRVGSSSGSGRSSTGNMRF